MFLRRNRSCLGSRSPLEGGGGGFSPSLLDTSATSVPLAAAHQFSEDQKPGRHGWKTFYCGSCGRTLSVPVPCGDRFCAVCSGRRRRRVLMRLSGLIRAVVPPSGDRLKMITLTIPNSSSPLDGCRVLINSFRRLRRRKVWSDHVSGGAFVLEVTGRPNAWHCHLHIICHGSYFPVRSLSKAWSLVSPGKIVDIRLVDPKGAVSYVTKYLTKCSGPSWLVPEISRALAHFRLFQPFGSWHAAGIVVSMAPYCCPHCKDVNWIPDHEIRRILSKMRDPPKRR